MADLADEQAHTVALHALVNDMHLVLHWLAIGLFAASVASGIHAIQAIANHDWAFAGIDALFAAGFMAWAWDTAKRGQKYGKATR